MYQIINVEDGSQIAVVESFLYITKAKNGSFVQCDKKDARGIAVNGTAYSLLGKEKMSNAVATVVANKVDGGVYAEQTDQNTEDATDLLDLSVDHEYRLTMLELGLSEI